MTEQLQQRKQKRRSPTTQELQANDLERKQQEAAERFRRQLGLASLGAEEVLENIDEVLEEDCE